MVALQFSFPTTFNPQANFPIQGSAHSRQKRMSKLHSSISPGSLFICNSQQPQHPMYPLSLFPPVDQSVAAIVFGDGSESRLYPLTKRRSEGAIPMAANYRLIDAVVSNCINSNINKIYALTQFNSTFSQLPPIKSLFWSVSWERGICRSHCCISEPLKTRAGSRFLNFYFLQDQGSADAIRRCLWVLEEHPVDEFLVLPGHHFAIRDQDPGLGLLKVNSENQVIEFSMKSDSEPMSSISAEASRTSQNRTHAKISSMGIYLINRDVMARLVNEHFPEANDFGYELIPGAISIGMKVKAYRFDGYWEDMRSIEAFYQANMECIKPSNMRYNFYDRDSPVYTMPRCLPPSLIRDALISNSVIGHGCIINNRDARIKGTIVGMRTRIGDGATIENSVIMGSDIYQIINRDNVQEGDREANGYIISGGIVVVLEGALIPDGSIL
ncbi:hypothetical protein Patl1_27121 [Pistacia atlantica]|uniref:Uncharacterized protein n=1 Tax=Pistacia atlantica TaxID=434234 RepID=A0ACC1B0H7_9ROSI|nr:hypothetical protein Patl1_27121 [Pistacia atlantica]